MSRAFKGLAALLIPMTVLITSCATTPDNEGRASYYDSAYNDHNRAPASMTPPTPSSDAASTIDPTYMRTQADYHFSMGEAYSLDGSRQKAIEAFKMTLVYDPASLAVRLRLATEYLRAGFISESIEQAEEVAKKDPKNVDARLLLGGLYSAMKNYDKAVVQYEQVMKIKPDNLEAPLYLGAVWSEQKQFDKAVKSFESLAKNPDYASPHLAWYYIGRVRSEQREAKYQKASEEAFHKALKIKPDHADSALALNSLYQQRKQEDKGVQFLLRFQKEQGPNVRVAELLSQYFIEKNKFDEAYEQLETLEQNGDDPLSAKLRMALILIEKKIYDKATAKLEDILKEAPESDKVRFYLAAVYEETKQDDKAIAHFRRIPADSTYFEEATIHAAYLMKGKNRLDDAIAILEKGLAAKKEAPQMYAMYASLLDEKGEFQKAEASLAQAITKFPENAQLRFYYGTINDRLGNKTKVIEHMEKVIELDPNHVQGLNYLAFTWAESNERLDEAEKLARRATDLEPKDGYILDTLGWILFKKGEYAEAVRLLEAAVRYQPTVSVIAEHLGDAYMKTAMSEKAFDMYNKALQLETDSKKIEEIKLKIGAINGQKWQGRAPAAASGR
ncbi:MAG: tetratricopeptide repeat protein [Bdellovibrionaceae bacterium]|nr:tetratricopeptide repeat protein [Pseudobdellovibrionaceae bacterium]MBX3034946.1 tetratricopeptide repeat protein [Pseudobdellovibrionaceae bacterium]